MICCHFIQIFPETNSLRPADLSLSLSLSLSRSLSLSHTHTLTHTTTHMQTICVCVLVVLLSFYFNYCPYLEYPFVLKTPQRHSRMPNNPNEHSITLWKAKSPLGASSHTLECPITLGNTLSHSSYHHHIIVILHI